MPVCDSRPCWPKAGNAPWPKNSFNALLEKQRQARAPIIEWKSCLISLGNALVCRSQSINRLLNKARVASVSFLKRVFAGGGGPCNQAIGLTQAFRQCPINSGKIPGVDQFQNTATARRPQRILN